MQKQPLHGEWGEWLWYLEKSRVGAGKARCQQSVSLRSSHLKSQAPSWFVQHLLHMGKCASHWLVLLSQPSFLVLLCGSESRLCRRQYISPLPTGLMLNSANRWCWRRQQEERRKQGRLLSFLCAVSAWMGGLGSWQQQPSCHLLLWSVSSQEPIPSWPSSAACSCCGSFSSNTRIVLSQREDPPLSSQVPDSLFLQPCGASCFLKSGPPSHLKVLFYIFSQLTFWTLFLPS